MRWKILQLEPPEVSQGLPKFTSTYFKSPGEPKMLHTAEPYVLSWKVEDSHTTTQTFRALHFIGKPVFSPLIWFEIDNTSHPTKSVGLEQSNQQDNKLL